MQRKKWRPTSNIYSTNSHRWLRCDVILGAPSKNCLGSGICRIVTAGAASDSCGCLHHLPAYCLKWNYGQLKITFNLQSVEPALVRRHFNRVFVQEEAVLLPKDLCLALGLVNRWIPAGKYQLRPSLMSLERANGKGFSMDSAVVFPLKATDTIAPQPIKHTGVPRQRS